MMKIGSFTITNPNGFKLNPEEGYYEKLFRNGTLVAITPSAKYFRDTKGRTVVILKNGFVSVNQEPQKTQNKTYSLRRLLKYISEKCKENDIRQLDYIKPHKGIQRLLGFA